MNRYVLSCLLGAGLLLGCGQAPSDQAAPEPQSPTTTVPAAPVSDGTSTPAPVQWAEKLSLDGADVLDFTESQGGVAGTEYTTLKITGDGAVSLENGGPGHPPGTRTGKLDQEATRKLFEDVQKSGLLDTTDAHTSQHFYSVQGEVDGVKLDVGVRPGTARHAALEKLVAPARAAVK